ncbi:UNVERIFIED_CONTAM: hypothetical protein Slati_2918100 [Sesamum latifolium]|uniref:RNase H type-1 domain-containing protein n=1 Tax=Sesamum latifolium TaxID=2727402 RepID=A0AAW2VDW2_9LAMI
MDIQRIVGTKARGKVAYVCGLHRPKQSLPQGLIPLPRIDLLVDSTSRCERLSMLDAYQGYNQIKLAKADQEKTSFITDRGLYCYNVMSFRLKNAGATYQRMKYGVKLNPKTCVFGVEGGKFLGYLVTQRVATSAVITREERGTHLPIYYTSRMLQGAEDRYDPMEKLILALVHTARKLRPYFLAHPITVLTDKPLREALQKGHVGAIKAQALVDFMIECPFKETPKAMWELYVDGSATSMQSGGGIVLVDPEREKLKFVIRYSELISNNEAKYETLLLGIKIAAEAGVRCIKIYSDSQLVVEQISGGSQPEVSP